MKNKLLISLTIFTLALSVTGCDKEKQIENKKKPTKVELSIVDINSDSRPYALMVNNHPTVRPLHQGLQEAFITYEIVVEGGITRYLALYKDVEDVKIHGIRSARHYYVDYALENDAYYIHWGGSPQAFAEISKTGIDSYEVYDNKYAYYDNSLTEINVEHRTYTNTDLLEKAIKKSNYREETNKDLLLNYTDKKVDLSKEKNAKVANQVDIKYSNSFISNFTYDADKGYYLKSVNDKKHTDYTTKDQYHYKNIITYQIKNYTMADVENKGRQEIENLGSGTGHYITNGYAIPIKWEKKTNSSQTKYMHMDGTEIDVSDGNTYIAIQPKGQTLTIE